MTLLWAFAVWCAEWRHFVRSRCQLTTATAAAHCWTTQHNIVSVGLAAILCCLISPGKVWKSAFYIYKRKNIAEKVSYKIVRELRRKIAEIKEMQKLEAEIKDLQQHITAEQEKTTNLTQSRDELMTLLKVCTILHRVSWQKCAATLFLTIIVLKC